MSPKMLNKGEQTWRIKLWVLIRQLGNCYYLQCMYSATRQKQDSLCKIDNFYWGFLSPKI